MFRHVNRGGSHWKDIAVQLGETLQCIFVLCTLCYSSLTCCPTQLSVTTLGRHCSATLYLSYLIFCQNQLSVMLLHEDTVVQNFVLCTTLLWFYAQLSSPFTTQEVPYFCTCIDMVWGYKKNIKKPKVREKLNSLRHFLVFTVVKATYTMCFSSS